MEEENRHTKILASLGLIIDYVLKEVPEGDLSIPPYWTVNPGFTKLHWYGLFIKGGKTTASILEYDWVINHDELLNTEDPLNFVRTGVERIKEQIRHVKEEDSK